MPYYIEARLSLLYELSSTIVMYCKSIIDMVWSSSVIRSVTYALIIIRTLGTCSFLI